MALTIGVVNNVKGDEKRVAITPDVVKRLNAKYSDIDFLVEKGAGDAANFSAKDYEAVGAKIVDSAKVLSADVVTSISPLGKDKFSRLKIGQFVVGMMNPAENAECLKQLAEKGVQVASMERLPRTSRAQSMDVLSSQANIGGYRAVLEATAHLNRFMPVMMTAAGSSRPAKVIVMGAGVAGLQAIATAKRLGAMVEAFDIRPEVKEQIESLGAKFIEFDLGEEGSGEGGYAKELSEEGKKKQQAALQEYLKKADVVITTAQIPGRKAPVLVTEDAVKGMAEGSVIVDMAASSGGNCACTKAGEVIEVNGVKVVGHTNYPAMVAYDASNFFARNVMNLLELFLTQEDGNTSLHYNLEDDIVKAVLGA